jgi:hypothetical protein
MVVSTLFQPCSAWPVAVAGVVLTTPGPMRVRLGDIRDMKEKTLKSRETHLETHLHMDAFHGVNSIASVRRPKKTFFQGCRTPQGNLSWVIG